MYKYQVISRTNMDAGIFIQNIEATKFEVFNDFINFYIGNVCIFSVNKRDLETIKMLDVDSKRLLRKIKINNICK